MRQEEREMREEWYYLHADPTIPEGEDENIWQLAFQLPITQIVNDIRRYIEG